MKWERAHFFSCPCSMFLGTSWRDNGGKHAQFGGLMVESMLIFCYYGEIHAHFCVLGWDLGDFGWNYGGMWVVRGGFMGEKLLHGDQECVVRVSPDH